MNQGTDQFNNQGQNSFVYNSGDNFNNASPNLQSMGQQNFSQAPNFNPGFAPPDSQQSPGSAVPAALQPGGSPPFQSPADFSPIVPNQFQRPPPPPPPPLQNKTSPASQPAATSDFGGNKSAADILQMEAKVCAARDPRLKQNSEKDKSTAEPSLADMFKSLDPTASPFG